jgi:adenylosuccinate lyase
VTSGLVVNPEVVKRNLRRELPFMATEAVLMAGVKAGGDHQELHEAVRRHGMAAARALKDGAERNDLLDRLAGDPLFAPIKDRLATLADPALFIGRAPEQTAGFLAEVVGPIRERYADDLGMAATLHV